MTNLIQMIKSTVHSTQRKANYYALFSILCALSFSSCSMIDEDLLPCAPNPDTFTTVKFVYDYNMQYTDLFDQHVGSVYLYVFDKDSTFLLRRSAHKADMGGMVDFTMQFDTTDLRPGNTYHMVAMAQGNHAGYEASLETPGFTLQHEMVEGVSKISDYIVKLDRDDDGNYDFGIVNYKDAYGNNQEMIDTVWSTKPDEVQTIRIPYIETQPSVEKQPDYHVDVTIPMMRITNAVNVNLLASSFTASTNPDNYHVLVYFPKGNGTIDFIGTTYPAQALYYQTLRKSMVVYTPLSQQASSESQGALFEASNWMKTRDDATQYALRSEFGVSRMQMNDSSSLQVRDAKTNELIAEIPNFSKFIANAFDYYGENGQEFLDREYEFEVTLSLKDPGPGADDPTPTPPDDPGTDTPTPPDDPTPTPPDDPGTDTPTPPDDPTPTPPDDPGTDTPTPPDDPTPTPPDDPGTDTPTPPDDPTPTPPDDPGTDTPTPPDDPTPTPPDDPGTDTPTPPDDPTPTPPDDPGTDTPTPPDDPTPTPPDDPTPPDEPTPDDPTPPTPDDPTPPEDPQDNWNWIEITVKTLDWSVRINNVKF